MFTGSLFSSIAGGAALGALVGGTIALALNRSDSVERFRDRCGDGRLGGRRLAAWTEPMMARMRRLLFALFAAVFVAALVSSALLDGAARTIAFVAVIVAGVVAYAAADQRHLQQK